MANTAPKPGQVRPEMGGLAMYNYVLGDALLAARYHNSDHRNPVAFHASVNWFLTLSHPVTRYYTPAWSEWQHKNLPIDEDDEREAEDKGVPVHGGVILNKRDRMIEVAHALEMLQAQGIFWFKKGKMDSSDASVLDGFFSGEAPEDETEASGEEESGPTPA